MPKERWKGKDWYQVLAPKFIGELVIGETPALEPNLLKGRIVSANLMDLTGKPGKFYINMFFKVTDITDNRARTAFIGHEVTRDFIARAVQTRTTRIDTNDILQLKDSRLRLKTITITARPVSVSIETKLRKAISSALATLLREMSLETFVKALADDSLQAAMRESLNKIYPIKFFEFRKSEVL